MADSSEKQPHERRVTDFMFFPKSVAVIGASSDSNRERESGWLGRLSRTDFQGKIFPINPRAEEICGLKAYPSISSVPVEVDHGEPIADGDVLADHLADGYVTELAIMVPVHEIIALIVGIHDL